MTPKELFYSIYNSQTEDEVWEVIQKHPEYFKQDNWHPLGSNASNYGVIENQQSSPIAALIEKITNSIDATLMRKCMEAEINPKSISAPNSMDEAVLKFYSSEHKSWDLVSFRKKQAEEIQILASGLKLRPTLTIYDNGEGQHPQDFVNTFLSLLRGNKNDIRFVQGKYNMGGTGAIVFCGKKRFQLVASKRFDNTGDFGFTLVRMHPLTKEESTTVKNTWYEFWKLDGKICSFPIDELDLGLLNRKFKTGSIIKLYSYDLPEGSRSVISRDLNQSINEFLFQPALPIYTIDNKERYPDDRNLERDLFGLKRRLEQDESRYVDSNFSEVYEEKDSFGKMKVSCYIFKSKIDGKNVKETRDSIRREFFKNGMSVLFSINGQVHGSFSSEFITRTLKFNLMKDHLLIHVDCTNMNYEFRKELFMASRDRLKNGEETRFLREYLGKKLQKSQLDEINKRKKESIGLESEDTTELLKSFTKNLPKDSDLFKLITNTLKLEDQKNKDKTQPEKRKASTVGEAPFNPERFPTKFKLKSKAGEAISMISVPVGGEKTVRFETDVEDHYFDRVEEAGEMKIGVLDVKHNDKNGGDRAGTDKEPNDLFGIVQSSPHKGTIKIAFTPTKEMQVGDEVQMKVSLSNTGDWLDEVFWIKIVEPEAEKERSKNEEVDNADSIGLPELKKVKKGDWDSVAEMNIDMDYSTVMYPVADGDKLDKIIINMDSTVFLNHRGKLKSSDQLMTAEKKYIASIYFHTLFLYMINRKLNYKISEDKNGGDEPVDLSAYIRKVFDGYYSDFLLNFGMEQLISALED